MYRIFSHYKASVADDASVKAEVKAEADISEGDAMDLMSFGIHSC